MKKGFALLLALVLVIGCVVGGTLAWLTATSDTVTNTFTVGDINIKLEETTGTSYKIIPGGTVAKDPTVTVLKTSEKCYVYAKVTNNLVIGEDTVATPAIGSKWTKVGESGNVTLYRYSEIVNATSADQKLESVFATVSFDGAKITKDNMGSLNNKTIEIQAYAHQSENTTQAVADAAAIAWAGVTTSAT